MSIKTLLATSAVALSLASSGAMADANFTGAYLGANIGYGMGKTDLLVPGERVR